MLRLKSTKKHPLQKLEKGSAAMTATRDRPMPIDQQQPIRLLAPTSDLSIIHPIPSTSQFPEGKRQGKRRNSRGARCLGRARSRKDRPKKLEKGSAATTDR